MVRNDIHRSHVLSHSETGKNKDARRFLRSLLVFVQGCGRKLFFACSGNGNGTTWNNRGSNGNYWSASFNSSRNARNLNFNSGGVNPQNNNNRYNGFAVRAVQHTLLSILLLFMMTIYGSDTAAAFTRPVSSLLRCQEAQIKTILCVEMAKESKGEHGRSLRRFVLSSIRSHAVEMLHSGLSEEEGDICCHVQRPYRPSSVLQLYAHPVREDIHTGYVQLHQGSWYSLRNRSCHGLLQEGIPELATQVLCNAPRHQGLLHAHCQEEALGDCRFFTQEDVNAQDTQVFGEDMGRHAGYGLHDMAYQNNSHAQSEGELCNLWRSLGLDRTRSCKVDAPSGGWPWPAYRQPYESAFLECLSQSAGSVHEASAEMQVLRQICGRCGYCLCGQGEASFYGARDTEVPESGIRLGSAHGQAGDFRGSSWCRVPWFVHQAIQDIYLTSCFGTSEAEDSGVRLLKALEGYPLCEQLSWHIHTYLVLQAFSKDTNDEGDYEDWHIQSGHDKVYRQTYLLQTFKQELEL